MIKNFKHKGLEDFYHKDTPKGINPKHQKKIRRILSYLDASENIQDLNIPGLNIHPLKGDLYGFWSISISGNYRIIFKFKNGEILDIDYLDYH